MTNGTDSAVTIRRLAMTMTAVLATTTLVGGCGGQDEPAAAPSATTATVSPKAALLASVPDGTEGTFRFTGKDSTSDVSGRIDPDAKGMELLTVIRDGESGITTRLGFLVIQEDLWLKVSFTGTKGTAGLPKLPNRWLKLDRTKLDDPDGAPTYEGADPGNAGPLIEAATSVEDQGSGRYAGMIDLTSGEAAKVLEEEQVTAMGNAARQVPFTAVVGADGNLGSLTLEMPAAGGQKAYRYVVTYLDYGTATKISEPSGGKAPAAPALAYELLNN